MRLRSTPRAADSRAPSRRCQSCGRGVAPEAPLMQCSAALDVRPLPRAARAACAGPPGAKASLAPLAIDGPDLDHTALSPRPGGLLLRSPMPADSSVLLKPASSEAVPNSGCARPPTSVVCPARPFAAGWLLLVLLPLELDLASAHLE